MGDYFAARFYLSLGFVNLWLKLGYSFYICSKNVSFLCSSRRAYLSKKKKIGVHLGEAGELYWRIESRVLELHIPHALVQVIVCLLGFL